MARVVLEYREPEKHFPRRWVAEARIRGRVIAAEHNDDPLTAVSVLAAELARQIEQKET